MPRVKQLSVPSTRRTLARIQALFGGRLPAPAELLAAEPGQLREAGLSWRKISTLRDHAWRLSDGRLDPDVLSRLPDDELMAELTAIPGIGPWTVQGALIIALGREDVVLPGDLALRKAVRAAYQLEHLPTQEEVLAIAEKWRPWGCEDCLAQGRQDWVHLRVCQECGHVGCCDNSPGRHATAHFRVAGHPVIRSYEPGEDWYWCYLDQVLFELEGAPPAPSHP